jgi:NADH-quinone oxidoreductase subunit J
MIETLIFYMFSGLLLLSSLAVVLSVSPVHSVLFLILSFFNAAGLFLLCGAELLSMSLIIVYVGAVAVLFLFVVMMLNTGKKQGNFFSGHGLLGVLLLIVLASELSALALSWKMLPTAHDLTTSPLVKNMTNAHALGKVLYTDYFLLFQLAGVLLLVAMIGAIVLTLKDKSSAKRQNIYTQVNRNSKTTVKLVNSPVGKGIETL